ncbi:MAG: 3D domain-containing protein [bacterium]|jgi:3D (Asp-Asp-Asp) domain-containing protein|nr:3D domain-containing protein [bacterium]
MDENKNKRKQQAWAAAAILCGVVLIPYYWIYAKVDIYVDGKVISARGIDHQVENVLRDNNIKFGPLDIIEPDIGKRLKPGQAIKITRVAEKIVTDQEVLPYTVTNRNTDAANLRLIEVQRGYYGRRWRQVKIKYHDQREFSREIIKEKVEQNKVYKLILKNKQGKPVKEYDLTKAKSMWLTATSYYPYDPMCYPGGDGIHTYLGYTLERGLVAVDPKIIPLRTRLYIPGYGYAYAADTGNAIKGKRIDLALNTRKESEKFGKRAVKVYILNQAEYW